MAQAEMQEEEVSGGFHVQGFTARATSGHLSPFTFTRRKTKAEDVTFKILYCGICHSDLHMIKNEWGLTRYPIVPGHEIVGIVVEVGSQVKHFTVGDRVGVGCILGSCQECDSCDQGLEQYCPRVIWTYISTYYDGTPTYGGFSDLMVCHCKYVVKIPDSLPLDGAAPLLCAGITVYSPIKHFGMTEPGKKLGVVGLGGLGHIAVKFGKPFGLHVTVISTSQHKEKEAREALGADEFLVSKDSEKMKKATRAFDFILDTVAANHDIAPLLELLRTNGKLVVVGAPPEPLQIPAMDLITGRRSVAGSAVGAIKETQEMLDFCGKHNITCLTEMIKPDYLNTAMERLNISDVKYRFVIDIAGSSNASA